MYTEQATQGVVPIDFTVFTNAAAASFNSAPGIDMLKFKRAYFTIQIGLMTATGTLDARLQSSPSSTFASNVHNMTGTNIVQIVSSGTNNNTAVTIEVRADQVTNQNSADRFVRINTTVATAAVNYGTLGQGLESEQKPGSQFLNTTTVPQSVICNT